MAEGWEQIWEVRDEQETLSRWPPGSFDQSALVDSCRLQSLSEAQ